MIRISSRLAAVTLAIALVGCATAYDEVPSDPDSLRLAAARLRLEDRGGSCFVKVSTEKSEARSLSLGMPWPCAFHKDLNGGVRVVEEGESRYILIESSKRRVDNPKDCETHLRSIRVTGSNVEISEHQDRVASCPPFQWDRMVFKELFE